MAKNLPSSFDKFKQDDINSSIQSNFGEQLVDCKRPVIVVYDIQLQKVHIIDIKEVGKGQKVGEGEFEDVYPALPIFDKEATGVVFQGF